MIKMDSKIYKKERQIINGLKYTGPSLQKSNLQLSPISNGRQISELDSKSSEDIISNSSLASNKATLSSGGNISFNGIDNINIKLYYFIYNKEKEIDILINEDKTIKDLIHFSLNIINEQLISEKLNIVLDTNNYNKYCIKIAKDNSYNNDIESLPKAGLDIPIINFNLESKFYLIWLDKNNSNIIVYKNNKINKYNFNNINYYKNRNFVNDYNNNNKNNININTINNDKSNFINSNININNYYNKNYNNINNVNYYDISGKRSDNSNMNCISKNYNNNLYIEPNKNCFVF